MENLTDGDPDTCWESDGEMGNHWIRLKMKKKTVIKYVCLCVHACVRACGHVGARAHACVRGMAMVAARALPERKGVRGERGRNGREGERGRACTSD